MGLGRGRLWEHLGHREARGCPAKRLPLMPRKVWPVIKLSAPVIKGLVAPCPEPGPEFPPTSVLSKSRTNQGP